ncbi:MAG: nicotinate-nucleotide adenylyltransferase [Colwellia sp.]
MQTSLKEILDQPVNIGIFGGTFDPIHLGHTESAKSVAQWLNISTLLFIPANIPPHKATPNVSAKQRAAMVELACKHEPLFQCDLRELSRCGNSYTVDTLKEIKTANPEKTLYFIVGMDSLLSFTTWHNYQEILNLCHLVVNCRPNSPLNTLNSVTKSLLSNHQVHNLSQLKEKHSGGILLSSLFHKSLNIDISSSQIRQNLKSKISCQHLLSHSVLDFINKNQLYR